MRIKRFGGPEFAPRWPRICSVKNPYILTQGLDRRWPRIDSLNGRWPKKHALGGRGFASLWVYAFARRARLPLDTARAPAHQCYAWGTRAWSRKDRFLYGSPSRPHAERVSQWMCLRLCLGHYKFWASISGHRNPYSRERQTDHQTSRLLKVRIFAKTQCE
jgi:hypothetical protein